MTRILVIAGWGRSGSTILANVLGSAPGVVTLGEINNVWERGFRENLLCSCGEPFAECRFWAPLTDAMGGDRGAVADRAATAAAGLGNTWLLRRRLPVIGSRAADRGDEYGRLLTDAYRAAAEMTGADLLVDASKSPWHCAIAADLAEFEVTVLHLVRDPRGVAYSLRKKVDYQQGGKQIAMDRHSPTASSLAWIYRNRLVEWEWRGKPNYLQMRYEDFIADPAARIKDIERVIGIKALEVPFQGSHEVDIAPSHNISGNPVRFKKGAVTLRADDAWKTSLAKSTQSYIKTITWPHMNHFGYA